MTVLVNNNKWQRSLKKIRFIKDYSGMHDDGISKLEIQFKNSLAEKSNTNILFWSVCFNDIKEVQATLRRTRWYLSGLKKCWQKRVKLNNIDFLALIFIWHTLSTLKQLWLQSCFRSSLLCFYLGFLEEVPNIHENPRNSRKFYLKYILWYLFKFHSKKTA